MIAILQTSEKPTTQFIETLFKISNKVRVDTRTIDIIRETLTDTSKVKLLGELLEAFEIKTGARQGD